MYLSQLSIAQRLLFEGRGHRTVLAPSDSGIRRKGCPSLPHVVKETRRRIHSTPVLRLSAVNCSLESISCLRMSEVAMPSDGSSKHCLALAFAGHDPFRLWSCSGHCFFKPSLAMAFILPIRRFLVPGNCPKPFTGPLNPTCSKAN